MCFGYMFEIYVSISTSALIYLAAHKPLSLPSLDLSLEEGPLTDDDLTLEEGPLSDDSALTLEGASGHDLLCNFDELDFQDFPCVTGGGGDKVTSKDKGRLFVVCLNLWFVTWDLFWTIVFLGNNILKKATFFTQFNIKVLK